MSVVGVAEELPDSPTVDESLNQRTYVRSFRVLVGNIYDGPRTVLSATGVPRAFDPYVFGQESDDYALCRHVTADRMQPASLYWKVVARYETPEPRERGNESAGTGSEKAGQNDNPLLMLPEVTTSTEKFRELIYWVYDPLRDNDKKIQPCRNSANQVFDPPPEKDASRLTLTITRNESIGTPHPSVDVIYADAVNADVFWGCNPGIWKCQGITTARETKQLANGTILPYLKCTYKFEARPDWDILILDAGTYYFENAFDMRTVAPNDKRKLFKLKDSTIEKGLLNGQGELNPDGDPPVFLRVRPYVRVPFGPLALPQSFAQVS